MKETTTISPGIYQHYKGPLYQVFRICMHTETEEVLVFYQSLYDDYAFWVRPLSQFQSTVNHEGEEKPRFTLIQKHQI